MKFRDILLALCAPLLLGFGFAIAKPAMQQFPPFLLMGLRFNIAALILKYHHRLLLKGKSGYMMTQIYP